MSPERGFFESLRISIPVSKRRNGGFCAPVSAAKNSVPGSRFGDWFDDCVGSMQFGPDRLHHPVFPNCRNRRRSGTGRFCGDPCRLFSAFLVSADNTVSRGGFWPPVSASKNSVPAGRIFERQISVSGSGTRDFCKAEKNQHRQAAPASSAAATSPCCVVISGTEIYLFTGVHYLAGWEIQ